MRRWQTQRRTVVSTNSIFYNPNVQELSSLATGAAKAGEVGSIVTDSRC